jgi:hypothetical protein
MEVDCCLEVNWVLKALINNQTQVNNRLFMKQFLRIVMIGVVFIFPKQVVGVFKNYT